MWNLYVIRDDTDKIMLVCIRFKSNNKKACNSLEMQALRWYPGRELNPRPMV